MSFPILLLLVATAAALFACYLGAGIIMHPPKMSRMDTFPEMFGLRYEKITFQSGDGLTLRGWFVPSPNGPEEKRTILLCHGWGDNKGDLIKMTHFLNASAGFNLLYFDFRSHGESDGEYTTIGYLETIDFAAAMDYLRREKPWALERLGVFALSMGAAVTAVAMGDHPEPKCAVLESPFSDFRRVVRQWAWNHYKIPYFPLIMITLLMLRLRVGESDVSGHSPVSNVARIAPRPLLVIGGDCDALMPVEDVRRVFAAAGEPKQLWILPEATHGKCFEAGGLEYETRVASFFKRHL